MKIGEVGNFFSSTIKIQYISDQTFIDFDFVIIDYNYIILQAQSTYASDEFLRRREKIQEFLTHKKVPLIIFAPEPTQFFFRQQGNNRLGRLDEILPLKGFDVEKETGSDVNVISNTVFTNFLIKYKPFFRYTSYFSKYNGKVIVDVPYTKKVLAFFNESSIFIPKLKEGIKQHENAFLSELVSIAGNVNTQQVDIPLPKWSLQYLLPQERDYDDKIKSISNQISELNSELQQAENSLSNIIRKKVLFTGTGSNLETEVKRLFESLGFEILESDPDRDDLIIKYNTRVAVVEIKGIAGSAAERHAVQLEKWVSIYHEKYDIFPKGILIINSYREVELEKRTADTFPHQMLNYSEKREHCLISAVQLLCFYFEIQNNPVQKEALINTLFDTTGIYKDSSNWKDYIQILS
jgi:hypothetical protein